MHDARTRLGKIGFEKIAPHSCTKFIMIVIVSLLRFQRFLVTCCKLSLRGTLHTVTRATGLVNQLFIMKSDRLSECS